ncbi:MAG TPA: SCO family protein [Blastocatellia bacterium]|nr:SCO family protein [Blastocatellia bacterium]HMV86749.1 SCO family protein [Blastocatellia bacterium]HMX29758.1 SCO family protein [Blastocatellia bacterium]HMY72423.1 SCO family protein [Blastocatellia bacterium]HMZ22732.1 SCO family protein [Blastocatellia bacterium]
MTHKIARFFFLSLFVCLSLSACKNSPPKASDGAKRFEVKGKVVSADKGEHKVTIQHEEIKGYMDAMTMPFTLLDDWVYSELKPGAQIQATLVVDQGRTWLENPVVTNVADPNLVGKVEETGTEPSPGAVVPNFALINQDGKKISFDKYRNQALVVTFIYTRCPLPDYCPLMSQNFQQIQQQVQQNPALKDKTHLLSITVDPDFDKPKVLRDYGTRYLASNKPDAFKNWEFATGSAEEVKQVAQFFGLNYWPEKDQIIHSLRTAIVTPDGKVAKVYRGNEWKPEEVMQDLAKLKL